jgi:hypothetical protein
MIPGRTGTPLCRIKNLAGIIIKKCCKSRPANSLIIPDREYTQILACGVSNLEVVLSYVRCRFVAKPTIRIIYCVD